MVGHLGHTLGDRIIQAAAHFVGVFVGLIPGKAHDIDQEDFKNAVAAQGAQRFLTAARGKLNALVRFMDDIPCIAKALQHAGHGWRRDVQAIGQAGGADGGGIFLQPINLGQVISHCDAGLKIVVVHGLILTRTGQCCQLLLQNGR
jgi:hypothetical protein